jgi:MYXO-CTERM domain-containing protein
MSRRTSGLAWGSVAALVLGVSVAQGAVITVNADLGDGEVGVAGLTAAQDGGGSASNQTKNGTLLSGMYKTTGISPDFIFQLPALGAGEVLVAAHLDVTVSRAGTTAFNSDLYGLPARSTNALQGDDFYAGTLDVTNADLLQEGQFTPASPTTATRTGTSALGDTALLAYLEDQYATAGPGAYVFLRYSPDFTTAPAATSSFGYAISSAETSAHPVLTLTTAQAPEPAGLSLLAGLGLLTLRRRRHR